MTVTPPDAPGTYEEAKASAYKWILSPEEIPGGGWGPGGPVAVDDFRQIVCGVDVEPVPPAGAFIALRIFHNGAPLYQTVRPVGAAQATGVVDALREAVSVARLDTRTVEGASVTFEVTPVSLQPDVAAYRQRRVDGPDVWAYLVYFAIDDCLVVFTVYTDVPEPMPVEFLRRLVEAVRAKS